MLNNLSAFNDKLYTHKTHSHQYDSYCTKVGIYQRTVFAATIVSRKNVLIRIVQIQLLCYAGPMFSLRIRLLYGTNLVSRDGLVHCISKCRTDCTRTSGIGGERGDTPRIQKTII